MEKTTPAAPAAAPAAGNKAPEFSLPTEPAGATLENPVLPADFATFRKQKAEAAAKVEPAKEPVKPTEVAKADATDDGESFIDDPLLVDLEEGEKKPETKKGAKKEEPKVSDEDPEKLPENLREKGAEDKIREAFTAQKARLRKEIETLRAEVETAKKGGLTKEAQEKLTSIEQENTTLKKQIEDQEKFVQIANLEMSQIYRDRVKEPREAMKQDIIRIARDNGGVEAGVSANEIYRAIQTGDRAALNNILVNLSESDKVEIVTLSKEWKGIETADAALRENAKVATEQFTKTQQAQQTKLMSQVKEAYDKNLSEVAESNRKKHVTLFKRLPEEAEGAEEWNAQVEATETLLTKLSGIHPSEISVKDAAAAVVKAALLPSLELKTDRLEAQVKKLVARLKQKQANTPAAGGSGGVHRQPVQDPSDDRGEIPSIEVLTARMRARARA